MGPRLSAPGLRSGAGAAPEVELPSLRRWAAVAALLGSTFIGTVNNSLANVAVPFMADDLGVSLSSAVWVITTFALSLGIMMPLAGALGDVLGPRRVFLWGMGLFAVSSLLVGAGTELWMVVLGRLGQGVGGAPVLPCIMATITRLFPADQRGRALGMWAAVNSAALAAGPSLGGVVVDHFGWRALFLISGPAIVVVGAMVWWLVPADLPSIDRNIDVRGALVFGAVLGAVVLPITDTGWGFLHPATPALWTAAGVLAVVLARHLRRVPEPFISPALLRARTFLAISGVAGLQMVALFAITFAVPVFYVVGEGSDAGAAGLVTSVLPASMMVGALVSGRLADRYPFRHLAASGGASIVVGVGVVAVLAPSRPGVALGLLVVGLGVSCIQAPSAAAVTRSAPVGQGGVAAGVFNTARFVLGGVGATVAALVFDRVSGSGTELVTPAAALGGLRAALAVGVLAGVAIVVIAVRDRALGAVPGPDDTY